MSKKIAICAAISTFEQNRPAAPCLPDTDL
jgi:hypothetical protein